MNVKLESDRLDSALPVQNAPASTGRHVSNNLDAGDGDSATISSLMAKLSVEISAEQARVEKRVSELARLYAAGNYQPDSAALSKALVSSALSDGVRL